MQNNFWLSGWCCQDRFGFYDSGTSFHDYRLLSRDGIRLSRRHKGIFGSRLSNLMRWVLNWRTWGAGSRMATLTPLQPTGEYARLSRAVAFLSCLTRWEPEEKPPQLYVYQRTQPGEPTGKNGALNPVRKSRDNRNMVGQLTTGRLWWMAIHCFVKTGKETVEQMSHFIC